MAQIKIYGVRERLNPVKEQLSEVIHSCVVDAHLNFRRIRNFIVFFP